MFSFVYDFVCMYVFLRIVHTLSFLSLAAILCEVFEVFMLLLCGEGDCDVMIVSTSDK